MLAVYAALFAFALCAHEPMECAGLDSLTATDSERRTALDACANEAQQKPIDFFLDRVAQLSSRDQRAGGYGDIAANWNSAELSQESTAARLLALINDNATSQSARVVALRAMAAIPQEKRPANMAPIEQVTIEISTRPSKMAYDRKEFSVAPNTLVHLILHNPDALEHNLLIVAPNAMAEIGIAGDRMGQDPAGKAKEFVPDSPKVLVVMGLVAPGKSKSAWFIAPTKPATYPYVCTVPHHWPMMNGKMKVVAPLAPTAPLAPIAPIAPITPPAAQP